MGQEDNNMNTSQLPKKAKYINRTVSFGLIFGGFALLNSMGVFRSVGAEVLEQRCFYPREISEMLSNTEITDQMNLCADISGKHAELFLSWLTLIPVYSPLGFILWAGFAYFGVRHVDLSRRRFGRSLGERFSGQLAVQP